MASIPDMKTHINWQAVITGCCPLCIYTDGLITYVFLPSFGRLFDFLCVHWEKIKKREDDFNEHYEKKSCWQKYSKKQI